MRIRKCFLILILMLIVVATSADLTIKVHPNNGWGGVPTTNITLLCENVVSHYQDYLREEYKLEGHINVYYDSGGPFVIGNDVYISAKGTNLPQFIYQFSHEVTHILHNHHITSTNNPNLWFHESICMVSSIWVLNEMSKTWKDNPPYPKWKIYRHNLKNYADTIMNIDAVQYNGTAEEWIKEWEDFLRTQYNNFSQHLTVAQLSYTHFLGIFEEYPQVWNAVRQMPATDVKINEYMFDWLASVNDADKEVVQLLINAMELSDEPVASSNTMPDIVLGEIGDYIHLTCKNKNSMDSLVPINPPKQWYGYTTDVTEKYPDGTRAPRTGLHDNFDEMHILEHWIYTHAPAVLTYDISSLPVLYFSSDVILPHPHCGGAASIELIALADDVEIYSKEVYLVDSGIHIEFDIPSNTEKFDLLIGDLGNQGCDHVVLGEPRIYIT
ncbi:MAG: hypothetical protein OXU23_19960, partial [Candidatus Poribacteria bacterium]|nr:hypothetical protein [Candidatus Poribacteria bacterium]